MNEKDRAAVWMLGLLAFSYALVSADRRVFGVLADGISFDLGLTNTQTVLASDATLLAVGVSSLGVGYLTRIASRKAIAIAGLLIASLATLGVGYSQSFTEVFVARLMVGVGISLLFSAALTIGIRYFARQRYTVVALVFFAAGLGTILGINIGGIMEEALGWRKSLIVFGLFGLPLAMLMLMFVKPWFTQARVLISFSKDLKQPPLAQAIWSRQIMLLGAITTLLAVAVFGFRNVFFAHLREVGGFNWQTGQVTLSVYAFANLFAFYGASLFKQYGARTVLVTLFSLVGILSIVLLIYAWNSITIYMFCSMLLGIGFGGIATITLMSEMIRSVVAEEAPLVIGWFMTCLFGPAFLLTPLCWVLSQSIGWRGTGLVLITGSAIGAGLLALLLPRVSGKRHKT